MTPFFVADIGNSRIKCGVYRDQSLYPFTVCLDEVTEWQSFLAHLAERAESSKEEVLHWPWTVAAVKPAACEQFVAGLNKLGFQVRVLSDFRDVPITVDVDAPERVGIDRLLSAAFVANRLSIGAAAAIVSVGTAVTIDLVDSAGTFRGGVILPGFRLMGQALHEKTALLPLVEQIDSLSPVPARNTESAINAGISAAISGAIDRVVEQYRWVEPALNVFLTGGDAGFVNTRYCKPEVFPLLALLGVTLVAGRKT